MTSVFTGSVVVVDEVPSGCVEPPALPELPAVPDAGGEGEHALADAGPDTLGDVAAVSLEGELALGGLVDRLDPLADMAELAEARLLVLAVGAHEVSLQGSDDLPEPLAREALVGDDDLCAGEQPVLAGTFEQPQPVAEGGRDARQVPDERADLRRERAQPLVVARLLGDVREQVRQGLTGQPNKPSLGMTPKHDLRDRQRDELGIGDLRATACTLPRRQEVVRQHIKCDEQAVEVGVHEATSVVDVALATPAFDSRATSPRASAMLCANSESVI